MLLFSVAVYAAAVTGAMAYLFWRSDVSSPDIERALAELSNAEGSLGDRAQMLKAVAEVRNGTIRWFERAVSAIGVFALLTMTVATAVQTIRAAIQEEQVADATKRLSEIERRLGEADVLIQSMAGNVLVRASRAVTPSDGEKRILRYRLERLGAKGALSADERQEAVTIAIALREFARSVDVIEGDRALFDRATVADQISLAEYYYLSDNLGEARALADRANARASELSPPWRLRLLEVRLLLNMVDHEAAVDEAARVLRVDRSRAQILVDGDVLAFKQGATELRASK